MSHYPPDEDNYMRNDSNYCLQQAEAIGEYTHTVTKELLQGGPIRNLRSVQNIVRMAKKYSRHCLEGRPNYSVSPRSGKLIKGVQIDVCQQRTDDSSLRTTLFRLLQYSFHHASTF